MVSFKVLGAATAAYFLGQQVQCPFIAVPLVADAVAMTVAQVGSAAASFGGAIAAAQFAKARGLPLNGRAVAISAPAGVPQYNFDMCVDSLMDPAVTVTVTGPVQNNGVQIDGLPNNCMVLNSVFTGDGLIPTPCGSACLLYNNLNADQYGQMQSILGQVQAL